MRLDHLLLSTDESVFHRRPHKFPAFRERVIGAGVFTLGVDECVSRIDGALAQLGEHLLCKQGVVGSIPTSSTRCDSNGSTKALGL